ncbi:NADPH-dependent FMN reductase [Pseudomonas antarctica]|jgi:NAD(P)H-dependent FMN reductase|uniref:NADPH-dependent FMN reductase n=1 Tax=Pseudomonas antarctica TaxID=219572 RepID=A0A172Z447_9PSED|nr:MULTISPECIES: NADPH-dependent FMN reductase [Pseudomonas]ANF87277.1 NADPH-dependent FMN reductase [Pseudomonas antarctica]MBX7277570.1 NAD(P)H-dependent oxidoreductase [Pseudomonas sp. ERGC3:01]QZC96907.1 NAD(P)H-dependent oxidoreductase [Pseudomonas sp. ERGC3:05]UXV17968.1 NAD(P)H-dependent oxidoreductase [Pseudomonas fluorescens]
MIHLLALSGSLREASSNSMLLSAAVRLCPQGVSITSYDSIGQLPHFNPDLLNTPGAAVLDLYDQISRADGLLISCPEYARGIPGSFKNMLDWLVSLEAFAGMPVALYNASPRASAAQAALRLVLETLSAVIVDDASFTVNLLASKASLDQLVQDHEVSECIRLSLENMATHIDSRMSVL